MVKDTIGKIEFGAPLSSDGQKLDREHDLEHDHIEIYGSTRRG